MGCSASTASSVQRTVTTHAPTHVPTLAQRPVLQQQPFMQLQQSSAMGQLQQSAAMGMAQLQLSAPVVQLQRSAPFVQGMASLPPATTLSLPPRKREITEDVLNEYQSLSMVIAGLERKNVVGRLDAMTFRQRELQKELSELQRQYSELDAKTRKEFADVNNLKALGQSQSVSKYFASQHDFQRQFSKEEEEFLQAKAEQENCHHRLMKLQEVNAQLNADVTQLRNVKNELLTQHSKQDQLLEQVFGGTYGSTLEDELEGELDQLEGRHRTLKTAMERWRAAESFVSAATGQLKFSCKRWSDVDDIPKQGGGYMVRMQAINEVRNNLLAAIRNLTAAQQYLSPVNVPYCGPNEMATLNRAIANIYFDGMDNTRHKHAKQLYKATRSNSKQLNKWISNTLEQRIVGDVAQVRGKCIECRSSLRKERMKLMQKKVEEVTGKTVDISEALNAENAIESDPEETLVLLDSVAEVEKVEQEEDLDEQIQQAKAENVADDDAIVDGADGGALVAAEEKDDDEDASQAETAPVPARNELFGDLDTIMAAYDLHKQAHDEEQQYARAKQEAAIQDKLRKRRSRAARLETAE